MNTISRKLLLVLLTSNMSGPFSNAMIPEATLSKKMRSKQLIDGIKELPYEIKRYIMYILFQNCIVGFQLCKTISVPASRSSSGAFSHTGESYLTSLWYNTACMWNSKTGSLVTTFHGDVDRITSLACSPDGETCITGTLSGRASIWDSRTGERLHCIKAHNDRISSLAVSFDRETALTGAWDTTVCVWNYKIGKLVHFFQGHTDKITSLACSPDGETVLSGSKDTTACVWSVTTGNLVKKLLGHSLSINAVAFSQTGKTCLTASLDQTVRRWNCKTGELLTVYTEREDSFTTRLWDKALSFVASCINDPIRYVGYDNSVLSVAFSPDEKSLLTGLWSGAVCMWDTNTGDLVTTFKGNEYPSTSLAFNPDGRTCFVGSASVLNVSGTVLIGKAVFGLSHVTEENKEIVFKRFLSFYSILHHSGDTYSEKSLGYEEIESGSESDSEVWQNCIVF